VGVTADNLGERCARIAEHCSQLAIRHGETGVQSGRFAQQRNTPLVVSVAVDAINAWEYFRNASREPVVTRSSGSLARMARAIPDALRQLARQLVDRSISAPSSDAFSRTEVSTRPSLAAITLAERT